MDRKTSGESRLPRAGGSPHLPRGGRQMTEPDDLVERFRAALPPSDAARCPSAEESWAAAVGDLPFERLQTVVDHGARCAECAEAWRILAEIRHEPDVAPASTLPLPPPMPQARRTRRM